MTPARYILLLLLGAFFAVLGVAQRAHVVHLGYRVSRLEAERALLAESNRQILCEISVLAHPARIAGEVGRLNIALLDPVALTKTSAGEGPGERREAIRSARR